MRVFACPGSVPWKRALERSISRAKCLQWTLGPFSLVAQPGGAGLPKWRIRCRIWMFFNARDSFWCPDI